MIKGTTSVDGIELKELTTHSHKRIIKICDKCGKESNVALREVYKSRKRTKTGLDPCFACAQKENGLARRKGNTLIGAGYYATYIEGDRKLLHREIMAKEVGRPLTKQDIVHHIDGDKINNKISNLFLGTAHSHANAHSSLETVGFELVKRKLISFDKNTGLYNYTPILSLEESLGFDSISFKQKKNICKSRLDAKTNSEIFRGHNIEIPIIAANMSTVINSDFLIELQKLGSYGFLHRALKEEDYIKEVQKVAKSCASVPVSIGVGQKQYELANKLITNGANVILVDIAHGYSDEVINLGRQLKKENNHIKVVVGNTVNTDMMEEVNDFADAVKVGIAQGFACETKNTAGCTEKQFSAVYKFKDIAKKLGLPIISDGAIREGADFAKAIAAGANSVMAGSIFAACPESAAPLQGDKKLYAGMASEYVQNKWRGGLKSGTCAEGGVRYLDLGKPVKEVLEHYQGSLRSGITYSGASDIKSLQDKVEFIKLV